MWNFGLYGTRNITGDEENNSSSSDGATNSIEGGAGDHAANIPTQVRDFYGNRKQYATFRRDPARIEGWSRFIKERYFFRKKYSDERKSDIPDEKSSDEKSPGGTNEEQEVLHPRFEHKLSLPSPVLTSVFQLLGDEKITWHSLPRRIWDDIAKLLVDFAVLDVVATRSSPTAHAVVSPVVRTLACGGPAPSGAATPARSGGGPRGTISHPTSRKRTGATDPPHAKALFLTVRRTMRLRSPPAEGRIILSSELCWEAKTMDVRKANVPQRGRLRRGRLEFFERGTPISAGASDDEGSLDRFRLCVFSLLTLRSVLVAREWEAPSAGLDSSLEEVASWVRFLAETDWPDARSYVLPQDKLVNDLLGRLYVVAFSVISTVWE